MQATTASSAGLPASFQRWRKLPVPARRALLTARRWRHPGRRPRPAVTVELVDGVAVMRFDDGKVNALSARLVRMLSDAFEGVEASQPRALVVVGRPGQFCAGFDLNSLMVGGSQRDQLVLDGWSLFGRILTLPLPVVAACTGHAIAAGAALLLVTDERLGADGAFKIGFNEAAIGLPIPGTGLLLARERLHPAVIEDALPGARLYRPQDAVGAGFLHRVVAPAELVGLAIAEARALADDGDAYRREKQARVGPLADRMRGQLPEDIQLLRRFTV
jgi:enoyl-CoA hydratase